MMALGRYIIALTLRSHILHIIQSYTYTCFCVFEDIEIKYTDMQKNWYKNTMGTFRKVLYDFQSYMIANKKLGSRDFLTFSLLVLIASLLCSDDIFHFVIFVKKIVPNNGTKLYTTSTWLQQTKAIDITRTIRKIIQYASCISSFYSGLVAFSAMKELCLSS